jgi:hypothetical protein
MVGPQAAGVHAPTCAVFIPQILLRYVYHIQPSVYDAQTLYANESDAYAKIIEQWMAIQQPTQNQSAFASVRTTVYTAETSTRTSIALQTTTVSTVPPPTSSDTQLTDIDSGAFSWLGEISQPRTMNVHCAESTLAVYTVNAHTCCRSILMHARRVARRLFVGVGTM